jgi:hypothetical protein
MRIQGFNIIAFDENWNRKGIVDPSVKDGVYWLSSAFEAVCLYIETNKPENEHWLVEVLTTCE